MPDPSFQPRVPLSTAGPHAMDAPTPSPAASVAHETELLRTFQRLWRSGATPDIDRFVATAGTISEGVLGAIARVDLRHRWSLGAPLPVESYFQRFPELEANAELAVDLIHAEFLQRERHQQPLSEDEFFRRFPRHQRTLRDQFSLHAAIAAVDADAEEETERSEAGVSASPHFPRLPGYKIVEEIGRGGMGVVYKARDLQLHRLVAIKFLLSGAQASAAQLHRFHVEAEAAARLQHPRIVQVHEIGEHEGRPYLVLEYVAGGSLADRFGDQPQPPRWSAALIEQLARTVAFAHQHGVIHRDLKPANVLLTSDTDGHVSGEPSSERPAARETSAPVSPDTDRVPRERQLPSLKIADFGLAKLSSRQAAGDAASLTQSGDMLGTPGYISPEQAAGRANEVGVASDVYSLGAMLYSLLTGRPPFGNGDLAVFLQQLAESEPVPPSQLVRGIAKDLQTICLKCLEKKPTRRYESALDLADDLARFQSDLPILARPASAAERGWRWCRRNWAAMAAVSLVFLALFGGVIGTSLALREARNMAAAERMARSQAQHRLSQLAKANEILASIFQDLNPQSAAPDGEPLQALLGERLDHAAQALDAVAIDDSLAVARMRKTLGDSLRGLGYPHKSIPLLTSSFEALEAELGGEHRETLRCLHSLASSYLDAGNRDAALERFQEAWRGRTQSLDAEDAETLTSAGALAGCYLKCGRLDLAFPLLNSTYESRKTIQGPEHPDTIISMNDLALGYMQAGRPESAVPLLEQTLELLRRIRGPDHPETLTALNNLAVCHKNMGRLDVALPLHETALDLRKTRLGADHPDTLVSMNNLASAYWETRQLEKSIPLFETLLVRKTTRLGEEHPSTLLTAANLGRNYQTAGRLAEALPLLDRAQRHSSKFAELKFVAPHLGELLVALGKTDEAIRLMRELVADARQALPAESLELAAKLAEIGWFYLVLDLRAPEEAELILRESLSIRERKEPDAWTTFNTRSVLGSALLARELYAEAEPILLEGYLGMQQRQASIPPQARRRLTESLKQLVRLYGAWNKPDDAAKWQAELERSAVP